MKQAVLALTFILSAFCVSSQEVDREAYGRIGCNFWLDVESDFENSVRSNISADALGCELGLGYVSRHSWGVDASYGTAPDVTASWSGLGRDLNVVEYGETIQNKYWTISATYERKLTDKVWAVGKAGVTHTRTVADQIPVEGAAAGLPAVRQTTSSNEPTVAVGVKIRLKEPEGPVNPGFDVIALFSSRLNADSHGNGIKITGRLTFPVKERRRRR